MASRCSPAPGLCTSRRRAGGVPGGLRGPLDLLLYLIRKQNFNILDIPMVDVTRQYLGYVDEVQPQPGAGAEYLLMAAHAHRDQVAHAAAPEAAAEGEPNPEDPRAELVRRLLEYEQMKQAAMRLNQVPQYGRDFIRAQVYIEQSLQPRFPDVDLAGCSRPGATSCAAPNWCSTTASRARSYRCAST